MQKYGGMVVRIRANPCIRDTTVWELIVNGTVTQLFRRCTSKKWSVASNTLITDSVGAIAVGSGVSSGRRLMPTTLRQIYCCCYRRKALQWIMRTCLCEYGAESTRDALWTPPP